MVIVFIYYVIIGGLDSVNFFSSSNHCWVSFSGFSEAYNDVNAKNIERFCEVTHGMLVLIVGIFYFCKGHQDTCHW